ncbi:hypothetical protein Tco_0245774 [Tanacetum coccineum]
MSSNTPDYIYPIIISSDFDVEDAFSSTTTPNYTSASPGNTSPDPSDDLSKYLLASLAISPFHDNPYMKVMQAYNGTSNGSPIPPQALIAPQTVLPPSPVLPLSPMFDPQNLFLPEEILPPKKQACSRSSSSISALSQVFEIGESSHKMSLERHEEQIEDILNHLDELSLDHIEEMEGHVDGQLLIAQKEKAGIQLQAEEFYLMVVAGDLDEIKEVNANCILMANLQQASTSGTQTDNAHVYDSDGSTEVHEYDNCYNNDIFNIFTQEEQYTELLEPIPEPHQVQQNDNDVISVVSSVERDGRTVEQHHATVEETRAYFESLYNNLAIEVEKVNTVNRKMKETNADLTTKLARYKNQEKVVLKSNQEKIRKLKGVIKSLFIRQCLTKKINALHLSFGYNIMTLNEKIANLNNQLSKENSTVSFLNEEKKS